MQLQPPCHTANVTLVAFYGDKPAALARLVSCAQARLVQRLAGGFVPYPVAQVHATIIGLEARRSSAAQPWLNANYLALRAQPRAMHLGEILALAQRSAWLPLTVQLGGFSSTERYPFSSRGQHPYERSFSISGSHAVIMGWPTAQASYPTTLGQLRREFEHAGALHKYHAAPDTLDNDLFFVLGRVQHAQTTEDALRDAVQDLRDFMARACLQLVVTCADLQLVRYSEPSLERESSTPHAVSAMTAAKLAAIFDATQAAE